MVTVSEKINQLPGYRIPSSHFRIGSKIHVSDFYYAKRFFQNSFFSSRLAFLVVKDLLKENEKYLDDIRKDGLTLIGYGLFSELFLSLIEKFLKSRLGIENINHDLINDIDEPVLIKRYELPYKHVMIIVPIASTFLTGIKIEDFLRSQYKEKEKEKKVVFLQPVLNIIHVANRTNNERQKELEAKFGWVSNDPLNKTVEVRAYFSDEDSNEAAETVSPQRYVFALPSNWHEIESCELCFPPSPTAEKPLFYTEITPFNPALVFATPQGRLINEPELKPDNLPEEFKIQPETLFFGHYLRDDNHFRYYIKVEEFFNHNKPQVTKWLKEELRNSERFRKLHSPTDRTIIISPGHYSNAGFVNLVNETLFSNSATIIHYDPRNDDIQNFKLFYENEFQEIDTKVFFVDDTITSGTTFIRTNYFLKHTRSSQQGVDACIFLMDRSSHFTHENVLRKMDSHEDAYFVFANINLPSSRGVDGKCPLCLERDRYKELVNNTFLDRLKIHFLEQQLKLSERRIRDIHPDRSEELAKQEDRFRYTRRMEVIDRMYRWFVKPDPNFSRMTFHEWKADVLKKRGSEKLEGRRLLSGLRTTVSDKEQISAETAAILKVLTQPPFSNYQPLRKKTFEWVIGLLDFQRQKISDEILDDQFKFSSFRDFKFLVRRAGQLNSNYLISKPFFEVLKMLYSPNGIAKLLDELQKEKAQFESEVPTAEERAQPGFDFEERILRELKAKLNSLDTFRDYYAAQIKELLFLNEARSIRLEEMIKQFEQTFDVTLPFKWVLRILDEENGIVIQKFWEFIENNKSLLKVDVGQLADSKLIREVLTLKPIRNHYRFQTLETYFEKDGQPEPEINEQFLDYLWLMIFFKKEKKKETRADLRLSQKTELMMERMRRIISSRPEDSSYLENSGAFLVVSYGLGLGKEPDSIRTFFAHNSGKGNGVDKNLWNADDSKFLEDLFRGGIGEGSKNNKSIIELERTGEDKWINLYSARKDHEVDLSPGFIPAGCNRLLLMRVNKRRLEEDDGIEKIKDIPQAIVGFYYNDISGEETAVSKTRYLLLLRSSISEFIENHHENDEFRDWIEAENKRRTALLTGHGREMLIDVAQNYPKYREIISTILLTQRFILDQEDEKEFDLKRDLVPTRSISHIFREIFQPQKKTLQHKDYGELWEMGREVFKFKEIENTEVYNITKRPKKTENFHFPIDILKMICFELFVNAKKNRWIFLKDETINVDGKIYDRNQLGLKIETSADELILTISNTGPRVPKDVITDLKTFRNPKKYESVAGIELITKLLTEFHLGSIDFDQEVLREDFCCFSAILTLKPWPEVGS